MDLIESLVQELPESFGVKQAKAWLEVDYKTVRNIIYSGRLKARKIAGKWLIQKKDFKTFLLKDKTLLPSIRKITNHKQNWLTMDFVCQLFSLSYTTIYRWTCIYLFFPWVIKIHGQIRIYKETVMHFILKHPGKIVFAHSRLILQDL